MAEPVRHRQTKEAATGMFDLQPPRHTSTLRFPSEPLLEWSRFPCPQNFKPQNHGAVSGDACDQIERKAMPKICRVFNEFCPRAPI
jgi:hypothetical protein